jgi:hypothetical protein
MSRAHRPIRRVAALAAACVGAAFLLTACIDINADLTVNSDAKTTGTLEMVLQKQAASVLGVNNADDWGKQISSQDPQATSDLGDCTAGESDAGYTYTCSFTDVAFTDPTGPWTVAKSGDDIVFTVKANAAEDASANADALGGASLGTMTIKVTFPGAISQTTGDGVTKTADNAATITGDLTKSLDVTITAASSSSSGLTASAIIVVLVGLAVIVLIIIVAVVMITRRRKTDDAPPIAPPGIANAHQVVADATATTALTAPLVVEDAGAVAEPPAVEDAGDDQPGTPPAPPQA